MTNLIVTILAVLILAAAGVAGFYYGGQSYKDAQGKAEASALVSSGMQIASGLECMEP